MFDLRNKRFVAEWQPHTPFEEMLGTWLRQECLKAAKASQLDGFIAIAGGVAGMWAAAEQDQNFHNWLSPIEEYFVPRFAHAIRERRGEADTGKKPVTSDDRGTIWSRIFFNLRVAQLQKKINVYIDRVQLLERQGRPVPSLDDKIKELTAGLPEDYNGLAVALSEINHAYRQHLAEQLAPALNARIRMPDMPHDTYEQKKELARWVNEELRRFDLAIKGPTGQPSLLLVMTGHHPETGRFVIEHKTPEGKRVRPVTTTELPHLELMEATPRREALLEWRDKVGRQPGGSSRA